MGGGTDEIVHKDRRQWQSERVEPRTQRRWPVAERQLDEPRQSVESGQSVCLPSSKLSSFSAILFINCGFSFLDSKDFSSNRQTFYQLLPVLQK